MFSSLESTWIVSCFWCVPECSHPVWGWSSKHSRPSQKLLNHSKVHEWDNASSPYTCFKISWGFLAVLSNLKQNLMCILCSSSTSTTKSNSYVLTHVSRSNACFWRVLTSLDMCKYMTFQIQVLPHSDDFWFSYNYISPGN